MIAVGGGAVEGIVELGGDLHHATYGQRGVSYIAQEQNIDMYGLHGVQVRHVRSRSYGCRWTSNSLLIHQPVRSNQCDHHAQQGIKSVKVIISNVGVHGRGIRRFEDIDAKHMSRKTIEFAQNQLFGQVKCDGRNCAFQRHRIVVRVDEIPVDMICR
jgi:hypothetical protein